MIKLEQSDRKQIVFPVLMQDRDSSLVVWFIDYYSGTVIRGNNFYDAGTFDTRWIDCRDTEAWRRYDEGITIKN